MQKLAKEVGEEGEYAVFCRLADHASPQHLGRRGDRLPESELPQHEARSADHFPGADEIDTAYKTTLDVIKTFPNLKGILAFGSNGPIGAGSAVRDKGLGKKIAVIGTVVPSQAKPLIMDGTIREGYLWNPRDAGDAMVAVAELVLGGTPIVDGVEIPGLGKAVVDVDDKQIKVEKIMIVNKDTVDGLIKQGL